MSIKLEVGKEYLDGTFRDDIGAIVVEIIFLGDMLVAYKTRNFNGDVIEDCVHLKEALEEWKEYTEPKKMIKMYQYAWSDNEINSMLKPGEIVKPSEFFFKTSEDFEEYLTDDGKRFHWVKRLDYTMIKVEDV